MNRISSSATNCLDYSRLPALAYGGDYNPEQWPEQTIDDDMQLMSQAGVNLVTINVFSWTNLEPSPGEYDFSKLVKLMDKLHANGQMVDLATPTAAPPAWIGRLDPTTLPVNENGLRMQPGSRQHYCPTSTRYLQACRDLVRALAETVKDHPALAMWHIHNEYACHTRACYCENCISSFQSWLSKRYRTIEALNAAWGTQFWSQTYTDFSHIGAPQLLPTFHNPSHLLDWLRYNDETLLACFLNEAEILRSITPQIPVTTNFQGWFPHLDYFKWAEHLDVITDDCYPEPIDPHAPAQLAFVDDLMFSLADGKPYLLMEQAPGAVQWRPSNSARPRGQFYTYSLAHLAHGANGILQFQWRQSKSGAEMFHSGMVPHSGKLSSTWHEVEKIGDSLKKLQEVVSSSPVSQIGLVTSWPSRWARACSIGPTSIPAVDSEKRWHEACFEAGHRVRFWDAQSEWNGIDDCKILLIPALYSCDASSLRTKLEAAIEKGMQVIISAPTALTDITIGAYLNGYLGGDSHHGLQEILGIAIADLHPTTGRTTMPWTDWYDGHNTPSGRIASGVKVPDPMADIHLQLLDVHTTGVDSHLRAQTWAEELIVNSKDVEVVAEYSSSGAVPEISGLPAITYRPYANGGIWYVSTHLDAPGTATILAMAMKKAGLTVKGENLPAGVEMAVRGDWEFKLDHRNFTVEVTHQGKQIQL